LRRLCSPLACTGDLRRTCALRRLSSRAVCIPCGLRHALCIRLAADRTLWLAPSCSILQSSCPVNLKAFAQKLLRSVIASASVSGLRLPLRSLAVFPTSLRSPSARTGDQLQLSSRAAHLARPQCNLWLAPQATCLWQRRRPNLWLTPAVQILRQSWRPVPGSRWLPHLRLAPVACCPLLPFPESFS
jgi:hypothetical protein